MEYKITSKFGFAFKKLSYFPFVMIIIFILSNLINYNFYGILFLIFLLLPYYFLILKKILRAKDITFDKKNIYFKNEEIPIECILAIDNEKIKYMKDESVTFVFFNCFLPDNIDFLKDIVSSTQKTDGAALNTK
jgi:hypothetical protein